MRLITTPASLGGGRIRCRAALRGTAFAPGGSAPASVCVELIAQAAAAMLGASGAHSEGHLVAVRALELFADSLGADDRLEVEARVIEGDAVITVEGSVARDGAVVGAARLTIRRRSA